MATQDIGGILNRDARIGLHLYWGVTLYFYDSNGNIEYVCSHEILDALTSNSNWAITKYTLGSNGITVGESQTGICDNKATLTWRS